MIFVKGDTRWPLSFWIFMQVLKPEEKISELLQEHLEGTDMFLTEMVIKPNNSIKIFLDADGSFDIGKCASVNRKLYRSIEDAGIYPEGDFSLEVSSPGVDAPLRSFRQFKKNVGRTVEVADVAGNVILGILEDVNDQMLKLHIKGTKKEQPKDVEIPVESIKTIIVQVTF